MKKLSFTLALCLVGLLSFGQYYYIPFLNPGENPGALNADGEFPYDATAPNGYDLVWSGEAVDPVWTDAITIPFTFNFNGTDFTELKVSTSGVVTFDVDAMDVPSTFNEALPSANIPDNSFMLWGVNGVGLQGFDAAIITKTFGTAPNRQFWIQFNTFTLPEDAASWLFHSVVIEETTNVMHVVPSRAFINDPDNSPASFTIGMQIDGDNAYQVEGSPEIFPNVGTDGGPGNNIYYSFIPGTEPTYDVQGKAVTKLRNLLPLTEAPFSLNADFFSFGSETITSLDLNYTINGGDVVTTSFSGLNIAQYENFSLESDMPWAPETIGDYDIAMWVSNINGNVDENPNNNAANRTVEIGEGFVLRQALFEVFTSSTCPPCVPANATMLDIFGMDHTAGDNAGKWTMLKYQVSWPGIGDPYYTLEVLDRRNYYSINSVPWVTIDGGWNQNGNNVTQSVIDEYSSEAAFIDMSATHTIEGSNVAATVTLNPLKDFTGDKRLFVAVLEHETYNNINSNTNGETEFQYVFKKFLTPSAGLELGDMTEGTTITEDFDFTFVSGYRTPADANVNNIIDHTNEHSIEEFDDLMVIAWVQDVASTFIEQSAFSELEGEITSLAPVAAEYLVETAGFGAQKTFKDVSINNPTSWEWTFGDGETGTGTRPSHTYTADGDYEVCVTAKNAEGEDTYCSTITVEVAQAAAAFTFEERSPLRVRFTNGSENANAYSWDFGDGNSATSTNPTHVYAADGEYTVCLVAANPVNEDEICQQVTVASVGVNTFASEIDLTVFPNPATDVVAVNFTLPTAANTTINVTDISGKVVMTKNLGTVTTLNESMNVSTFAKGVYLVEIATEGQSYTSEIIVK